MPKNQLISHMKKLFILSFFLLISTEALTQVYYPGKWGDWQSKTANEVGMDQAKLDAAIQYIKSTETTNPRSMEENHYGTFGREPYGYGIGPFKDRGEQTGIIIKDGYIIAEWGEPFRVDMTHSVTKTFLSSVVGIAYDKGLIRDVNDQVDMYMAPLYPMAFDDNANKADNFKSAKVMEPFKGRHNSKITWDHLLRQTSDWEGTLWGKPDWADRPDRDRTTWLTRERNEPGAVYEYNDVRVNILALAIMNVLRTPLPEVLRNEMMDPIGASPTWRWMGYENSWVIIDGQPMQAVSGGGHWGGGMFISARDQARLGLLTLRRGKWEDRQILSEEWVTMALTPTPVKKDYGFMNWFLNTDKERLPDAPESSFFHLGAGTNMVYCDPENDLIIVTRWVKSSEMNNIVAKVIEAID